MFQPITSYYHSRGEEYLRLLDTQIWDEFRHLQTEMIITKTGRKLFPTVRVQLHNLDPHRQYRVALKMILARNCRLKFQAKSGWKEAGNADPQLENDEYEHFDSYKTGEELMMKPLSFDRIRLTNSLSAACCKAKEHDKLKELISLNSMHEYLPTVILSTVVDGRTVTKIIPLEETKFIAVTAYQNEQVTRLKIAKNPFAKGFRDDGQAKSKRKKGAAAAEDVANVDKNKPKKIKVDYLPSTVPPTKPNHEGVNSHPAVNNSLAEREYLANHLNNNNHIGLYDFHKYFSYYQNYYPLNMFYPLYQRIAMTDAVSPRSFSPLSSASSPVHFKSGKDEIKSNSNRSSTISSNVDDDEIISVEEEISDDFGTENKTEELSFSIRRILS